MTDADREAPDAPSDASADGGEPGAGEANAFGSGTDEPTVRESGDDPDDDGSRDDAPRNDDPGGDDPGGDEDDPGGDESGAADTGGDGPSGDESGGHLAAAREGTVVGEGTLLGAVAGDAPVVTLHLDDHHLVLETADGEAVGAWRNEEAALDFARTLVAAAPEIRIIVSTWPSPAIGALAEHLRRAGWRMGLGWPAEVALLGTGATHDPVEVLGALDGVGARTPAEDRPVDEGLTPIGRHHVWHDGDGPQVERTGLEGQPLD